jgi:Zn-dependent M28 family amino/carboxypeptidase
LVLGSGSVQGMLEHYRSGMAVSRGAVLLLPEQMTRMPEDAGEAALVLMHESSTVREHWSELAQRVLHVGGPRLAGVARDDTPAGAVVLALGAETYAAVAALRGTPAVSLVTQTRQVLNHTWNAVAQLQGHDPREKEQIILLSAHLDHLGVRQGSVFNGADDDASGTTAVLALASALAGGAPLKRTVVFAAFGSEEIGSYGARYFIDKPVVPLTHITANLEFEMIGRPDPGVAPHTLWLTGWDRSNLGPELAKHGAHLVGDPHPEQNFFARSDNIKLARRGVVAQTVSSFGLHGDYHQPTDTLSRIDFPHMTESIASLLEPIRWLADGDFTPEWNPGKRP